MSRMSGIRARLDQVVRRRAAEERMDEEMRFHLEMEAERLVREQGLEPAEARRRAVLAFGGVEGHREAMRAGRRIPVVEDFWRDVRYAARSLRRSPAFTAAAVLTLALGIGLNTAVFSIINALSFRPLPFRDPDAVVAVYARPPEHGARSGIAYSDLQDLRSRALRLEGIAGYVPTAVNLAWGEEPERVSGAVVTANLFPLLGVQPRLGRAFLPEEEGPAGREVVILGEELWRSRFGGAADVLGQVVRVNGTERRVVGVMPSRFRFPETARIWLPLLPDPRPGHDARSLLAVGRIREGVALPSMRSELHAIAQALAAEYPESHGGWSFGAEPFRDQAVTPARRQMLDLMLGAVGLVLLIACANVANLLLARNAVRRREIAIRMAIGAGRGRLVRHLLAEALLLSMAAGALGVLIATAWLRWMLTRIPLELPFFVRLDLDGRVLAFTLVVSVLTGVLFGLLPAWRAARPDLRRMLADGGRAGGYSRSRLRSVLVAGEVALSLLLLISAALLIRSAAAAVGEDVGFDTQHLLTFRTSLVGEPYDGLDARSAFLRELTERIASLPGVREVAAVTEIPGDRGGVRTRIAAGGGSRRGAEELPARWIAATPGFFRALETPLLAGRAFTPDEAADSGSTAVVLSRSMAERLWPGVSPADAVGREVVLPEIDEAASFRVIAVAPDLYYHAVGESDPGSDLQVHLPYARAGWRIMSLLVRTTGDPASLAPAIRREVRSLDPSLALFGVRTMEEYMVYSNWDRRLSGEVFTSFGAMALLLALLGVYGVASYAVSQRSREIGVRIALGARRRDVLRLVLREGAGAVTVGLLLGMPAALAVAAALRGLLYGVGRADPVAFGLVPLALGGVAMLACALPARRAARVHPAAVLREE